MKFYTAMTISKLQPPQNMGGLRKCNIGWKKENQRVKGTSNYKNIQGHTELMYGVRSQDGN